MFKRVSTVCLLAIAALSFAGTSLAADSSSQQASGQQSAKQLMQSYRQDAQQLRSIHQKTIKSDPKLAKEQSQFENQLRAAVKKQGYDVKAGQKRMQAMAKKLQSGKLSDKQRKSVMNKFQKERQKMMTARNAAMAQPAIQKSGKQLQQDTIKAMQKRNPKTKQLIADMRNTRTQLQKSAQAHSGNGSSSSK